MNRIKESININLLLLSISLGSFITAILIIISPVSKIHLPKTLKLFLRIILTTSIDNLIRATILMLIGLFILFILAITATNQTLYFWWMITGIISFLSILILETRSIYIILNAASYLG